MCCANPHPIVGRCGGASRAAPPGVIRFDIARSLTDPNTFLAIEVFEDRAALDRQNARPEVANMLRLIDAGALTSDYEWTVWEAAEPEQT